MNETILSFTSIGANILSFAIIGRVLLSWINLGPGNPIVAIIYQITEPILAPIRRALPSMGMLDFAPMVALLLILLVRTVIFRALG